MFLGEELGSDVAFKKVLALILRGKVSQWGRSSPGFALITPKGEWGAKAYPAPRVEGLVR